MINEDRKERFYEFKLNSVVNNVAPIKAQIKRVSKFENIYKKDLCDFNFEEIVEMYKLLNYTNFDAILVVNNTLISYTDWCLSEHLVLNGQNNYQMLTQDMLNQLLNKTLIDHQMVSRDTVLTWAESLANPRDRFIMLSIFEYGKSKSNFQDIIYAKMEDIDESINKMKLYSGRVVDVSDALIQFAKDSNVTLSVVPPYGNKFLLEENGTIIKKSQAGADNPVNLGRNVYSCLVAAFKSIGIGYMTANKLHVSGQIRMVKELAKKYNVSCEEIIQTIEYRSKVEYQYDSKIRPTLFLRKYGSYLK